MTTENIRHDGENTHKGDKLIAPKVFRILFIRVPRDNQQLNKQLFLTRAMSHSLASSTSLRAVDLSSQRHSLNNENTWLLTFSDMALYTFQESRCLDREGHLMSCVHAW